MNPHDQAEFAEIICLGFTENEIEHLETFANYYFDCVERGVAITLPPQLVLDILNECGGDVDENSDG